jgi:hypothetical protein
MFDSLDEQMQKDLNRESTSKERLVRWAIVAAVTAALFFAIVYGVRTLE